METGLQRCLSFIQCQLQPAGKVTLSSESGRWRAVTISRLSGSGGHAVAERLAQFLQTHAPSKCPWTVFDRNLVEQVLADHHLPGRLAKFMPEDRISRLQDILDELLGTHPPSETLVRQITETVLRLAELGNVILIGRGANVITAKLDYVFHVRLVGSEEKRIRRIQELQQLSAKEARAFIRTEDRGRERYLKEYFGRNIDDPLLYHLMVNTDLIAYDEAARIIGTAMLSGERQAGSAR